MKANELPINNFLQAQNVQFVIPVYQRNYDWTSKECNELLKDVITVENENRGTHFIGSIVFIHEGIYSTSEVKELVIIDGQQRLTTINILYVSLYRYAKENDRAQDAERLLDMFLTNKYVKRETNKLKLKQTDINSLAFSAIMNSTEQNFDKYSNVIENYNFFRTVINEVNFETVINGLGRLIFVEISLERDKDDPQRIFESLNSTGLDLSQSDLIRNFILMDLDPKNQQYTYDKIWNPIEENAKDFVRQKSLVSEYIRDYLTLRNKKIPNKRKVYKEFKKLYPQKNEAYQQELENIKSLSSHYKKFINPQTIDDLLLRKELERISKLEINVAYPFLLQIFEDEENGIISMKDLIRVLKLIQTYTWRRFIVGLPTNALNKIFMSLYSEVDKEEYYDSIAIALLKKKGNGKFPSNEEIKVSLLDKDMYNTTAKNRNYMFEMLENFNNREFVDTSNESITIEHIFPQTPTEKWSEALTPLELLNFKEKYINSIGNLTLSGNNGALSNKSFLDKKNMNVNGREQGYIFSRLWLNKYLQKIDIWNIETFNERSEIIYKRFLEVWEMPNVIVPENNESLEVLIYNAESPKNKKLEYFIFQDSKIDEQHIAGMYFYVIEKLYNKNPQLLNDNSEVIKLSRNIGDFRTPQSLNNGLFAEANLNSESKFRILKRLLQIYDMEDELLLKYDENNSAEPNRFEVRKKYWKQLLIQLKLRSNKFIDISPSKHSWIQAGAGIGGVSYCCEAIRDRARVSLVISTSNKERNKKIYKILNNNKSEIESKFGSTLEWFEMPENKMSYVKYELINCSVYEEDTWNKMNEFFLEQIPKMVNAFSHDLQIMKY
ncbi:DUF4268 domain-containing protein [Crocinitomicaceae bacterium]|nr:DUF4268 domain-containing protein [Crocinitomicaceae bacterium]